MHSMRIALVSPYSWTYPGGVTRHIESLAAELIGRGHDVRVLAPYDPCDRLSARLHRGHMPEDRPMPDYLVPLGRTVGFPANGAVSNLAASPSAIARARRELDTGGYDVVHVHEPVAPLVGWDTLCSTDLPLVGTFHCYSDNVVSNGFASLIGARRRLNQLKVRIAVSDAAAWTGKRFYGGRYRVIPNGVQLPADRPRPQLARNEGEPMRIAFVGQSVERKGLPILLRAFEALREHVPAELTLVGVDGDDVAQVLEDSRGVTALGKVDDATKDRVLREADVLAAPSLGGESFGMVLTEAFAQGTPVVASDIPGYRDVVREGVDGVLVARGDATALAEALRDLGLDPERRRAMALAATERAERFAWPQVADEVLTAYRDAIAVPVPATRRARLAVRSGFAVADGLPRVPATRLASLEVDAANRSRAGRAALRRIAMVLALVAGIAASFFALRRIGIDRIGDSLVSSSPPWVLAALGLMCLSMIVRAVAWHAILKAALPQASVRRSDALQGTMIGVLMSATLPARLGEPARAMIVARRVGRPKETLPVVVGTLVSQTLLNIVALLILGITMFSTVHYFDGQHAALVVFAVAPIAVLLAVLVAPALLRSGLPKRSERVARVLKQARAASTQVRAGLAVFKSPRLGATATVAQLGAWGIQWVSCYTLLVAFGLDQQAGIGAAAAVLFAVNVTAVLPATPSNVGVFQAACVAVLTGAYGVSYADALGYGIILQAVEIATAIVMGTPALLREGLTWKDVRLRAMHVSPVELAPAAGAQPRRQGGEAYELDM
ncbi:glycosyltransferase [Paraconexibacter sp. AEG42_29]|uniref:Glycosyltransferase n=1 Tax=Paraconexibacter sp. AEG42_29 TaxID=2997339 RepID=A0AAU7AT17_9ACTN